MIYPFQVRSPTPKLAPGRFEHFSTEIYPAYSPTRVIKRARWIAILFSGQPGIAGALEAWMDSQQASSVGYNSRGNG